MGILGILAHSPVQQFERGTAVAARIGLLALRKKPGCGSGAGPAGALRFRLKMEVKIRDKLVVEIDI
jgi:hypothetical protein